MVLELDYLHKKTGKQTNLTNWAKYSQLFQILLKVMVQVLLMSLFLLEMLVLKWLVVKKFLSTLEEEMLLKSKQMQHRLALWSH